MCIRLTNKYPKDEKKETAPKTEEVINTLARSHLQGESEGLARSDEIEMIVKSLSRAIITIAITGNEVVLGTLPQSFSLHLKSLCGSIATKLIKKNSNN